MSLSRILVLVVLLAPAGEVRAQVPHRECGAVGGAAVVGTLTYEDQRLAASRRAISLVREGARTCSSVVDTTGTFAFVAVPPGAYRVVLASLRVSPPEPVPVRVVDGDTVRVHLHAAREDALADCAREHPACAAILATPVPAGLSATEAEEFGFWRAVLGLARAVVPDDQVWVACVSPDLSPAVRAGLSVIHPNIAVHDDCALTNPDDLGERWPGVMIHLPSGTLAQSLTVVRRETPDGPFVGLGRVSGGLNGQWWQCALVREAERFVLGRCFTTAVS